MRVDAEGWVDAARRLASPNCDERPPDAAIELVVIHAISLPPGCYGGPHVVELFQNRLDPAAHPYFATIAELRVSAHFLIARDGALAQFVSCRQRAWHAGASSWNGRPRCNDFSLGIELEGRDDEPFADAQYRRLDELLACLRDAYPLRAAVGHADVAPGRKTDPGPCFDWSRVALAARGVSAK